MLCTDIDGEAAERTAAATTGPGGATSAPLDVTDAAAVQAAVDGVVARAGRLDFMFNNAGIVWGGDTELLTLDQWNAIIDVNIRGVVHGVAAAYPVMIRQGHGHIVNTASLAGLVPGGRLDQLFDDQARRRRAVAGAAVGGGLARGRGARGLPRRRGDADSREGRGGRFRGAQLLPHRNAKSDGYDPDLLARDVLRAIERKRGILVAPKIASAAWLFVRLAPA